MDASDPEVFQGEDAAKGRGKPLKEPNDPAGDDKGKDRDYEVVINGTKFVVEAEDVTYGQVVALGFPNGEPGVQYSVVYRKAKGGQGGSGTLAPGTSVTVKQKGTSFDVTPTTRS